MTRKRILVVGGVAAGPAAAAEAKRTDPDAEVVLFEQGRYVSYGACEMPYLLSEQIEAGSDLVVLTPEELKRTRGVEARVLTRVTGLDLKRGRIHVTDQASGKEHAERFDALILATGARAAWPDLDGVDTRRVSAFRTLEDAERVASWSRSGPHRWVVVGGGFVGCEVADELARAGHRVTLIAPGGPMGAQVDPEISELLAAALSARGIAIRNARVSGFRGSVPGAAAAFRLSNGELVGFDYAVMATGIKANDELAAQAGLKISGAGGIAVDDHMRSSHSRVWACGDGAAVRHLVHGGFEPVPLSPVAFRTARVAGHNAARTGRGARAAFPGCVGTYGLKAAGLELAIAGLNESAAREHGFDPVGAGITHGSRAARMPGREPVRVHLVADRGSRRLLGGQLIGADGAGLRVNALVPLLRAGSTVDDLYDQDFMYTPPMAPSHDPLMVAARNLQKTLDA